MVKLPESMDELVYFTQRATDSSHVKAWVYRQPCVKCKGALMGKPQDGKTGKVKVRAKEYMCPKCKYTVEKQEYEDTLQCEVKYTCMACKNQGETTIPFKRKKVQGVEMLFFPCSKCKATIEIAKKMKEKKKKGAKDAVEEVDDVE